jgi:NADPH:quinone reductase-like Zn-dependent oxidoreductase
VRAVVVPEPGGPEVLAVVERPRPEPIATEVLVRVHAAGVNPVDAKTRAGGKFLGALPFVLGWDVTGTVEEVGYGVTRFAPGDRVFGMPWFPREAGAYAEYVTAPSRHFALAPFELDDAHAAALPLAGLTAWQTLVETAGVTSGMRVLVHAAAGGVGHLAVQIAKARGAHVIGTARAEKHEFLAELGADEVVDYAETRFEDAVADVDVVLDLVGGETSPRSLGVLPPGGLLIVVPSGGEEELAARARERGVQFTRFLVEPDHAGLEGLVALVADGCLRVELSQVFALERAARAHEALEAGRTRGKIVLEVAA